MSAREREWSRREFIKTAAAGAIGAPFCWADRGAGTPPASERITAGIIGTGRMGRGDLKNILGFGEVQVVAVCDVDERRRADARRMVEERYRGRAKSGRHRGCEEYGDYRELLSSTPCDFVDLALPHFLHEEAIVACAQAGRHILTEKPLTISVDSGARIAAAVRAAGVVFGIHHNYTYFPHYAAMRETIEAGSIGRPSGWLVVGSSIRGPWCAPIASRPDRS